MFIRRMSPRFIPVTKDTLLFASPNGQDEAYKFPVKGLASVATISSYSAVSAYDDHNSGWSSTDWQDIEFDNLLVDRGSEWTPPSTFTPSREGIYNLSLSLSFGTPITSWAAGIVSSIRIYNSSTLTELAKDGDSVLFAFIGYRAVGCFVTLSLNLGEDIVLQAKQTRGTNTVLNNVMFYAYRVA